MQTLLKLSGVPETVLKRLVAKGYFKTKTEAVRAGILGLGKEFNLIPDPKEEELELVALKIAKEKAEMKAKGLDYLTEAEVKRKYGFE